MRTRTLQAVVALSCTTSSFSQEFVSELWPGEGRPVFETQSSEVLLRESASLSSEIAARVQTSPGEVVAFTEAKYMTIRAGSITAIAESRVQGRLLGEIEALTRDEYYRNSYPPADVLVSPNQSIEYLQYRAEGTCFIRIQGQAIEADLCPTVRVEEFRLDQEPEIQWWIQSTINGATGWVMVEDGQLKATGREF